MIPVLTALIVAAVVVLVALVAGWAYQTANRLDRLHVRYDLSWQALDGALARSAPARWMTETLPPRRIGSGADSFVVLREMARRGMGRVVLPCILGDGVGGLDRLDGLLPAMNVPVWVACHRDLADRPRIARLMEALSGALRAASAAAPVRG